MTRKLFGTDGIRGAANVEPMTAETALQVGMAAARHFLRISAHLMCFDVGLKSR